ncbi:3-hydroxybutyryl-CoA dehydrogenase [Streptomyces sp. WI04-05B]|uniref:3-hydroxybutyryl-CoA dehydrogenase n=1 Tax=Streptomyces TaxID=1883 RepID=UPI0029A3268A|nr:MULTISPECIES: 3-hydroxybutyryl-CoA dehydrogenase [unclassified Streptomyces]MDX2548120.1 3-hydroxybutyryl-CoA dehydrogenase [Streptomyces sp. WI04-05B]MDX2590300.1 3-hydroxybutyryl-CoA dehydrogenase [Streptomyces sp. WI04-05A]MDX3745680.1 3-hydroxybutyryl-CoA dehydrogenase [Streptomyces sp. AK08-02]
MSITIQRVGVVGCGTMGSGIAQVCALAGLDVMVAAASGASLDRGRARLTGSFDRALGKGKITSQDHENALARVSYTSDLEDLADRQLVVESISESEPAKRELFARLDRVIQDPEAVLASNTSSISVLGLARATVDGGRVIGMHFFNPVTALPLVEMVSTLLTDEKTAVRAEEFVTGVLGKRIIRSPDRAGFTVNALLIPYLLSAVRMVESGHVSADTVDDAMTLGCSHPMGPLRLADLIGLDVVASIAETLHEEFREPHYAPPPLLRRMVETGMLGRKTGQGFHHYDR